MTWAFINTQVAYAIEVLDAEQHFINYEQIRETAKGTVQQSLPHSNSKQDGQVLRAEHYSGRHYSKEEVQELIKQYSLVYGIQSEGPLCIAKLESGYNQFSKNSGSTASGVFQYLSGTWKSTDEGKLGFSFFDAEQNVKAAVKYMASRLNAKPWVVAPKCPAISKIN